MTGSSFGFGDGELPGGVAGRDNWSKSSTIRRELDDGIFDRGGDSGSLGGLDKGGAGEVGEASLRGTGGSIGTCEYL